MTYNTRPFVNKVRQAPEVSSKPGRIVKDLEQAKQLVALQEAEAERLRLFTAEGSTPPAANNEANDNDASVPSEIERAAAVVDEEPKENGSDAVERRIAKLVEDLPPPANEDERWMWEHKKVGWFTLHNFDC